MKEGKYQEAKNIRHYKRIFNHLGDMEPSTCAPLIYIKSSQ
jgi:hypothetical protein